MHTSALQTELIKQFLIKRGLLEFQIIKNVNKSIFRELTSCD